MGTKLAPDTVKSHEPDFAVVLLIIQANEFAFHKTHVGFEIVRGAIASVEVRTDARERQIDLPDHPLEVGDDGRIVTGVASYRERVNRAWEEDVLTGWSADVRL